MTVGKVWQINKKKRRLRQLVLESVKRLKRVCTPRGEFFFYFMRQLVEETFEFMPNNKTPYKDRYKFIASTEKIIKKYKN